MRIRDLRLASAANSERSLPAAVSCGCAVARKRLSLQFKRIGTIATRSMRFGSLQLAASN